MTFAVQGELPAILTTLVTQLLDTVYLSREIEIDAPAPFNDANAVHVINGIVKVGTIPKGAKPTKEISAAQNYGFALQIMRKPNDHKLDLRECRYTRDLYTWIEDKLGDTSTSLPADTIYKNFMGINGPAGLHYGLSKRMLQLYLLCLVREGKIRITLSGRNLPVEVIDYSNIAGIDFKVAILDAFFQIQRLKPPEGWEVLAPFAAVLLGDPALQTVHEDSEIQDTLQRLLAYKSEQSKPTRNLRTAMADLFSEIQQTDPLADRIADWEKFLDAPVDMVDPIPYLRSALEKVFEYPVYQNDQVEQADVDDFGTRKAEIEQAKNLLQYSEPIRAAHRYTEIVLPDDPALATLNKSLVQVRLRLAALPEYLGNETRLLNELLEPSREAIETYSVRFLQALEEVISATEQTRMQLQRLRTQPPYQTVAALEQIPQLNSGAISNLDELIAITSESAALFPAHITRGLVERELANWPQPSNCPLSLQNASRWIQDAGNCLVECETAVQNALLDKATLLFSDALRSRLEQGRGDTFIDALLNAPTIRALADVLISKISEISNLPRYLQRITVRKVRLSDFKPGKHTLEQGDVEQIVGEFRSYLLDGFGSDAEDEFVIVEIE
jgi:hypothetical protein